MNDPWFDRVKFQTPYNSIEITLKRSKAKLGATSAYEFLKESTALVKCLKCGKEVFHIDSRGEQGCAFCYSDEPTTATKEPAP